MPLLFIQKLLIAVGIASLLSSCSLSSPAPTFSASGFVADQGVIRLWRKNDNQQRPLVLMSVYSPFYGSNTVVTLYEYQNGVLYQIKRTEGEHNSLQLRFTENGTLSFMQRQLATQREKLSADDLALYQYQARRILEVSDALNAGKIRLLQGQWQPSGEVSLCDGETVQPVLNKQAEIWIAERAEKSRGGLSIAWLDGPEGHELLLVANNDFCRWEPTVETL